MIAEAITTRGWCTGESFDLENAIDTWTELTERMDESEFHPTTYYQLYRTYLQREVEENYQSPFCATCTGVLACSSDGALSQFGVGHLD